MDDKIRGRWCRRQDDFDILIQKLEALISEEDGVAYAWVKCEREEDKDCCAVLKAKGIQGRAGTKFHADKRHVRLSLINCQDDFNILIQKLERLLSEENGAATAI
ncbi:Alliinase, C-terminal [Dillenia turbinata]|uniref:Alliinase, C-terminal n=1 Tax=Dillenia turbinata TaxID=194707 RepID=A0AAN8VQA3_9MAGN